MGKTDVRILVKVETDLNSGFGEPYLRLSAEVCYMTSDGLRCPLWSSLYSSDPIQHLDALTITAQADPSSGDWYGWRTEFRQPYSVDLDRAQSMVKTLRAFDRGMGRISERHGRPDTFADYMIRAGMVLGATTRAPFATRDKTSPRSDGLYAWYDADSLRYMLGKTLAEFNAKHGKATAAA